MATKRAASRKAKPTIVEPEFEPLEKIFDNAKKIMLLKIETNIDVSRRVDNLMSVRDSAYRFWGNMLDEKFIMTERIKYFKKMQDVVTETYKKLYTEAEKFELKEFKKEDMKDYFEELIPKVKDIKTEEDLFEAIIMFQCIQPYGSQMNQIHQMILEEIEKRAAYGKVE